AGDTVAADAPLAEVDDTVARLQVRLAKATVSAAEVQVRGVQREADRLRKLRARDAVPQAQLDQVDSQLEGAKAQVEQAKAQLALARQGQADMVLKAPYAGRVIARLKAEGEWVANMPPSPVVLLAQLDPLELHLEAPEQSYGQIQAGTKIQVRLPAVDRTATVTVKRVIPSVGRNRAFTVIAELPNPGGALPAGLFAEAEYTP
ncbi:MAG: efflux RND transporter periplasmic adaptor subunit, partial [Myxococcales bacterium]|nr:efflux RND transporter periplasmic adaptor subunit [Myxococcales bacterium]